MYVCYKSDWKTHTDKAQLSQAQATQASIKKLTGAGNFRKVDWDALEGTWALDPDETYKKLADEISAITPAIDATKEGLEAALA